MFDGLVAKAKKNYPKRKLAFWFVVVFFLPLSFAIGLILSGVGDSLAGMNFLIFLITTPLAYLVLLGVIFSMLILDDEILLSFWTAT